MEYTIVTADSNSELVKKVNEMLNQGWETEGGVAISQDGNFHQAMILFDDVNEEFADGEEL
ncbi:MAG TPA: DUF1737 domain-containing protein [Ignavibacteria bacterium]|nr:DUF1737 domain-containing protein [Ignavibacteria bacterium]HQY52689.1 DUF1737 domain-containing protein [Ignavibacteria bacterium]HRB00655.1 DUF1737 domain-containing protein [Ignavibacteria bacterium]